ncbi:ABC transporter ATP-binding protein [Actinomadura viridis]|uniref:Branched-chain amino acid transport system ATP-binding protein n=1 Tax=Actinomadura viridis TaxID=58110 RepID=A0A931DB26_9ACTN|nr:ATP-binding cassette domain-containing protein [Actinomadura viridis]MBG6086890.1 branched-chain amino acid transport system ATP-binding protein [Actinomadura viridis]
MSAVSVGPAAGGPDAEPALEVRGLGVRLGETWALRDLTLVLPRGRIIGVVGPNGAGKSTLINVICGQVAPHRGRVLLYGRDITGAPPWRTVAAGVARTFQEPRAFADMSARENVATGVRNGRYRIRGRRAALALADELLERVGFASSPHALPGWLDFADSRRLELAKALALRPRVLLLDEVLAGLRAPEVEHGLELLSDLRTTGMTILYVEHVMKIILAVSDQVLAMDDGRKLMVGTPQEVLADPRSMESYLGGRHVYPLGG